VFASTFYLLSNIVLIIELLLVIGVSDRFHLSEYRGGELVARPSWRS
jgi:hypothetical protein